MLMKVCLIPTEHGGVKSTCFHRKHLNADLAAHENALYLILFYTHAENNECGHCGLHGIQKEFGLVVQSQSLIYNMVHDSEPNLSED